MYEYEVTLTVWQMIWQFLSTHASTIGYVWAGGSVGSALLISKAAGRRLDWFRGFIALFWPLALLGLVATVTLQIAGSGLGYMKRAILPGSSNNTPLIGD